MISWLQKASPALFIVVIFVRSGSDTNSVNSFIFLTSRRHHRHRRHQSKLPPREKKSLEMTQVSKGDNNGYGQFWAFHDKSTLEAMEEKSNADADVRVRPQEWKRSKYGQVYTIDLDASENFKQMKPRCKCRSGESSSRHVYSLGLLKFKRQKRGENNALEKDLLCLHRHKVWWMRPIFCSSDQDEMIIPSETIFILGFDDCEDGEMDDTCEEKMIEDVKIYRLILPLILPDKNGYTSCSLKSSSMDTTEVELHSETGGKVALYCGRSSNPFELIQDGVAMASAAAQNYHNDDVNKSGKDRMEASHYPLPLKSIPSFANKLGWCTWNSFYTQLNGEKITSAVKSLWSKDIPVKWIIIDDGWQHTTNDEADNGMQWGERLLNVQGPSPDKFGLDALMTQENDSLVTKQSLLSLKETISQLKLKYPGGIGMGLDAVLAWHALPGYWLGLSNEEENNKYQGPDTTLYYPHFSTNIIENDFSTTKEQSIIKGIGIANNPAIFYEQYHSFIDRSGFDGVKVDAQGVHGFLRSYSTLVGEEGSQNKESEPHRHQISVRQQDALASSILQRFSSDKSSVEHHNKATDKTNSNPLSTNNIMCMCHSPEIIYRLPQLYSNTKPLMRVSDDFYPENDFCHGPHIVACSFNSLLLCNLASPDWDMFWTNSVTGELHAMARAISGGPIYFSEKPSSIDSSIIEKLVCKNGVVLLCCDHARPIRNSLFSDPLDADSYPMVLWNINGHVDSTSSNEVWPTSGVLAIFNIGGSTWCYEKLDFIGVQGPAAVKNATLSPLDVEPFRHKRYANHQFIAVSSCEGILEVMSSRKDSFTVKVGHLQAHIVHILPIYQTYCVDFVVIGITGLYNFAGAVVQVQFYETNVSSLEQKTKIAIDTLGCGFFVIAYKFKNSFELNGVHTYLDGSDVEHSITDPKATDDILVSEEGKILSSFLQLGFYIHRIHLPCQDKTDTAKLEISIDARHPVGCKKNVIT